MYPSLPTNQEAIDVVHKHLKKYSAKIDMMGLTPSHTIEMLQFILKNITLKCNDK